MYRVYDTWWTMNKRTRIMLQNHVFFWVYSDFHWFFLTKPWTSRHCNFFSFHTGCSKKYQWSIDNSVDNSAIFFGWKFQKVKIPIEFFPLKFFHTHLLLKSIANHIIHTNKCQKLSISTRFFCLVHRRWVWWNKLWHSARKKRNHDLGREKIILLCVKCVYYILRLLLPAVAAASSYQNSTSNIHLYTCKCIYELYKSFVINILLSGGSVCKIQLKRKHLLFRCALASDIIQYVFVRVCVMKITK